MASSTFWIRRKLYATIPIITTAIPALAKLAFDLPCSPPALATQDQDKPLLFCLGKKVRSGFQSKIRNA
jgi:hypothetical protein